MTVLTPVELLPMASSLFVGILMLRLGLAKKAVEWRQVPRCASCGRKLERGRCLHCEAHDPIA